MAAALIPVPVRSATAPRWDRNIPPALRPVLRAFLLGYASAVGPRLVTLLLQHAAPRRQPPKAPSPSPQPSRALLAPLQHILRAGLEWRRFPVFCAALVGGSTLLEVPIRRLMNRYAASRSGTKCSASGRATWLSTFLAAWLSLKLLQSREITDTLISRSDTPPGVKSETVRHAGRTLDLTLFAATRALDILVGEWWSRRKSHRLLTRNWTRLDALVSRLTDPVLFVCSCAVIMWTWIYLPARLPPSYSKWISSAAAVDSRLLEALRRVRRQELRYGEDTGQAPLLQGMCRDFQWPMKWGDPARSIPFPCEMVHMGSGPSCEYHALHRFLRSWRWAMVTYLPLNLLFALRNPSGRGLVKAAISAARSSTFLGTFIALFYYGVCLARSRLGPCILGSDIANRQTIDGGLCVGTGCVFCGWSIMLDNPGRRKDMALFVAPRALATLLPRRYSLDKQWRETMIFAASTAVVFTCVRENRGRVRGLFGAVLEAVLVP